MLVFTEEAASFGEKKVSVRFIDIRFSKEKTRFWSFFENFPREEIQIPLENHDFLRRCLEIFLRRVPKFSEEKWVKTF